jgi:hypothetical protein
MPKVKLSPMNFPVGSIPTQPFKAQVSNSIPATQPVSNPEPVVEQVENKEEIIENPPSDWLQPKIYKSAAVNQNQPTSYSENKG